jgi:CxxC-x17-CxxC domain-containing protein|tara:strand:- start:2200 stop:2664 length:465 start_codon:yes stop_codon:yes gene_type:complete
MARFEKSGGRESRGRPTRGNSRGRRSFDDGPSFDDRPRGRGPSRFGGGRGGDRRGGRPEMHDVVCDECGKDCQVPFKPTSSKPIFCSECFEKHDTKGPSRGGSRSGPSSADLDIINEKLNKIMKALKIEDKPKKEKKVKKEVEEEDQSEEDQDE